MTKQWSEIAGSETFQALPDEDKDVAREAYFEKVVAPVVAPEHLETTRERFNKASGYRSRALPAGVEPSTAGAGRGAGPTQEQQDEQLLAPPAPQTDSAAPAPAAARTPRRGTTRGVQPFVGGDQRTAYAPGDTGGGRGRINTAEDIETDRLNNGPSTVSAMQTSRDMLGGGFQVAGLAQGAKAFAGAVDFNAADKTLQDFDAIDNGVQPTATAAREASAYRGKTQFGQPNAIVQDYRLGTPEDRAKMRAQLQQTLKDDTTFVATATRAVKAYQDLAAEETGKLPDFTDVKTLKGFTEWAIRNGVATTPTMVASMVGALGGPAGLMATSGGMAVGDMNSARGTAALEQSDPNRFHSADRIADAQAAQDEAITRHQAENAGTTAALAVPYAALDFLGPAGTLATGGAKGIAKKGIGQIVKKGAQEVGEEAVNEGGQEVVNIAGDVLAGERAPEVTQGDVNRVVNSAAAGALMGGAGHAGNVIKEGAGDAYEKAKEKLAARKTPMVDGKPNVYTEAADKGFSVNPPLTSDPATTQRSKTTAIFGSLAAQYGIPTAAINRAKQTADGMPLEDVGPFYARFVQALQKRGGVVKPIDAHALITLEAGPIEPAPEEGETKPAAAATEVAKSGKELTKPAAAPAASPAAAIDENGEEDFTGLSEGAPIDRAAHVAATSPQNELAEPTDAQKEAGNYRLGHHKIAGLDVSIENPQGSVRRARADAPVQWETEMQHHYGYIRGTVGQDGDHIDTFIKPSTPDDFNGQVFVVDQTHADGTPDEHKVMIGFDTEAEARAAYLSNYQKGWKGLGAITAAPVDQFKAWLKDGDTTQPFAARVDKTAVSPVDKTPDSQGSPADEIQPVPRTNGAELRGLSHDELEQRHDSALEHNKAVDLAGIRKFWGEQQATEAATWGRHKREKWLADNEYDVDGATDWLQERYIDDETLLEHLRAENDFDTESPQAMGRSIAIRARKADEKDFIDTPAGRSVGNAFRYAAQQGWKLDDVVGAMRDRASQWAGGDAPELFGRLFREAKAKPNEPAQLDVQRAAVVPAEPAAGRRDPGARGGRDLGRDADGAQRPAAAAPAPGDRAAAAVGAAGAGANAVTGTGRVIGNAGPMPNRATPIELRANKDGTLTPWHDGHELLDFDSAEPVKVPAKATDQEALAAISAAGAFGKRTKVFANKAAPAPTSEPEKTNTPGDGRAAAASRTARKRIAFKPETDTVLQALAKMGGLRRDDVRREFGLRPEELQHAVNAGNLRGFPFRAAGGMSIDDAITRLREAGYFVGVADEDLRHTLETAIHDELGGGQTLSVQGQMAEAERLTAEDAAERKTLMDEAGLSEEELAAISDDDIDLAPVDNTSLEAFMQAMGFSEKEIADETAKQAAAAQAGAAEGGQAAGQAPGGAGGSRGAETRPGAAAGRAGGGKRTDRGLSDDEAFASDYAAFEGRTVEQQVSVADSGQTFQLRVDAARALRELDARQQALVKLKDCLGGKRA